VGTFSLGCRLNIAINLIVKEKNEKDFSKHPYDSVSNRIDPFGLRASVYPVCPVKPGGDFLDIGFFW
jgi:hypothetical protein